MKENWVRSLGQEDPWEEEMATHSSILSWRIPWTKEPGGLQSMGSLGVGHDWTTSLSLFTFMHWKGNGNPLQCSCLENPRDRGAWWAAVYGVTHSRTRLKWLSSSKEPGRLHFMGLQRVGQDWATNTLTLNTGTLMASSSLLSFKVYSNVTLTGELFQPTLTNATNTPLMLLNSLPCLVLFSVAQITL